MACWPPFVPGVIGVAYRPSLVPQPRPQARSTTKACCLAQHRQKNVLHDVIDLMAVAPSEQSPRQPGHPRLIEGDDLVERDAVSRGQPIDEEDVVVVVAATTAAG